MNTSRLSKLPLAAALALLPALINGPAFADCTARRENLVRLLQAPDFDSADRLVKEIELARDCGPADRRAAKASLAERLLDEAKRLRARPGETDRADRLVLAAAALHSSWAAAMAKGDLDIRRKAFADAALAYQQAIEMVAAVNPAENRQLEKTLAYLGRRADEARHLAASGANGRLVEVPRTRAGNMGGVYSETLMRGAEATRVPVPILFEFNSDEFTPVGHQAAEDFARLMQERRPGNIIVTGHTDRVGSDEFNQKLSLRRARKVAEFLQAKGVSGNIKVAGKGKSEPRQLVDASAYDQAQIDELNRRVEFDWKK